MISQLGIRDLAKDLEERLKLSKEDAWKFANLIGDTPEVDEDGLVVVRDRAGVILDRLSIPLA